MRDGLADDRARRPAEDPDVVLDVPTLNVEELQLEVQDLRAHVSVRAELADFVKINIGVDAYLDTVKLGVKGVEAQVLLKVRLERILGTIERGLAAIENDPGLLGDAFGNLGRVAGELGAGEEQAEGGGAVSGVTLGETEDEAGRTVRRTVDEEGEIVETTLNESGEVEEEAPVGNVVRTKLDDAGNVVGVDAVEEGERGEDAAQRARASEPGGKRPVRATDVARRRAGELGVDLEDVEGTGSRGRVLVGDVEKAAAERG